MTYDDWKSTNHADDSLESQDDAGDCTFCGGSGKATAVGGTCPECKGTGNVGHKGHVAGAEMDEEEIVSRDSEEPRHAGHADPTGREWSSGLDEEDEEDDEDKAGEDPTALGSHRDITTSAHESFEFDKFMDSTLIKEQVAKKVDETQDTPQRVYNKKYRELASNRTRYRRLP